MEIEVHLCRAVGVSVINRVIASNSLGSVNMVRFYTCACFESVYLFRSKAVRSFRIYRTIGKYLNRTEPKEKKMQKIEQKHTR